MAIIVIGPSESESAWAVCCMLVRFSLPLRVFSLLLFFWLFLVATWCWCCSATGLCSLVQSTKILKPLVFMHSALQFVGERNEFHPSRQVLLPTRFHEIPSRGNLLFHNSQCVVGTACKGFDSVLVEELNHQPTQTPSQPRQKGHNTATHSGHKRKKKQQRCNHAHGLVEGLDALRLDFPNGQLVPAGRCDHAQTPAADPRQ